MIILLMLAVLGIWFYMLIRISKASGLLAVSCFCIPPLVLLALGLYWSEHEESDIKVPFFIMVGVIVAANLMIK